MTETPSNIAREAPTAVPAGQFHTVIDLNAHPLMGALAQGLPITLLADLMDPAGPRSAEIYAREGFGGLSMTVNPESAQTA
jgi:hypothetical protein